MCGICLLVVRDIASFNYLDWLNHSGLSELLRRRGPDSFSTCSRSISHDNQSIGLYGASSVLHCRGADIAEQPIIFDDGSFLLFNGEIYAGLDELKPESSDVKILAKRIAHGITDVDSFWKVFVEIEGEFACVFYEADRKNLWFCRDAFGRRSLLFTCNSTEFNKGEQARFALASVSPDRLLEKHTWNEVPPGVLFHLSFASDLTPELTTFILRPVDNLELVLEPWKQMFPTTVTQISTKWTDLFCISRQPLIPDIEAVSEDQLEDVYLLKYGHFVDQFLSELNLAISKRVSGFPSYCNKCKDDSCQHTKLAVLFSGGVDSMLLAALIANSRFADRLDLLNVAFAESAPDRLTGRHGLNCLREKFPGITDQWRLVEITIGKQELADCRRDRIAKLIKPADTVLDDSIGCVLWFASRGRLSTDISDKCYQSSSRILLAGNGADELLAGYSRHRKRFCDVTDIDQQRESLMTELEMELRRIGTRNLGRDDRVIADHCRELRLPFLDERFVRFVNNLPLELKCNLNFKRGVGEKLILRMALRRLGFTDDVYRLPKRAMQFGSRIAKAENTKEKGHYRCQRLVVSPQNED